MSYARLTQLHNWWQRFATVQEQSIRTVPRERKERECPPDRQQVGLTRQPASPSAVTASASTFSPQQQNRRNPNRTLQWIAGPRPMPALHLPQGTTCSPLSVRTPAATLRPGRRLPPQVSGESRPPLRWSPGRCREGSLQRGTPAPPARVPVFWIQKEVGIENVRCAEGAASAWVHDGRHPGVQRSRPIR